ncbi:hypothetical protein SDC9_109103 [bioreactor metagenome]|uniref:Uncharacterized protein n=1 Tax=bioreactor metagenome TaxID=1076179 RepID=A0A645BA06_9ZZZZ
MAGKQQGVNIVPGVFQPVLIEHKGAFGQAHGGQAIILGNDKIAGRNTVDQRKVHAVRPLGKGQGNRPLLFKNMGGVAQNQAIDVMLFCHTHRDVHHRTAVGIN